MDTSQITLSQNFNTHTFPTREWSKQLQNNNCPVCGCKFGSSADLQAHIHASSRCHFYLEATGNLLIAKSVLPGPSFLQAPYSEYGFKWDTVQHYHTGEWYFPGTADEPYSTCGEYTHMGCLSPAHAGQAYIRRIRHQCGRAGCPECYCGWLKATTDKTAYRIEEARKIFKEYGHRRTNPIHVTVSPPRSEWEQYKDIGKFNKIRQKVQQIAKRAGFHGGSIIFHPYRERCAKCGGNIRFKLNTCKECGSSDVVWYWSPHWHLFGFGWIRNSKALYEKTGYLVKNLGARYDMFELKATIYYQLSHCGVHAGKHVLTWFGSLHYSKLKIEPMEAETGIIDCPICGAKLRLVRYEGTVPPPELNDIAFEAGTLDSTGWFYRTESTRNGVAQ